MRVTHSELAALMWDDKERSFDEILESLGPLYTNKEALVRSNIQDNDPAGVITGRRKAIKDLLARAVKAELLTTRKRGDVHYYRFTKDKLKAICQTPVFRGLVYLYSTDDITSDQLYSQLDDYMKPEHPMAQHIAEVAVRGWYTKKNDRNREEPLTRIAAGDKKEIAKWMRPYLGKRLKDMARRCKYENTKVSSKNFSTKVVPKKLEFYARVRKLQGD